MSMRRRRYGLGGEKGIGLFVYANAISDNWRP
jgi:hypothetical protein